MLNSGCSSNLTNSYNTNTTGSNRSGKLRRTDQDSVKSERQHQQQHTQTIHSAKNKRTTGTSGACSGSGLSGSNSQNPQRQDSKDESNRKLRDSFSECRRSTSGYETELTDNWVEVGNTSLGPILLEGASALPMPDHKLHLVQHKYVSSYFMYIII